MNSITKVPREARWSVFYLIAALAVLAALVAAPQAHARSSYGQVWSNTVYPTSTSDSAGCDLCHGGNTNRVNRYGLAIRAELGGATQVDNATIEAAIRAVELPTSPNSDLDPGVFSNVEEINANTQPGWRGSDTDPNDTTFPNDIFVTQTGAAAGTQTAAGAGVSPPLDPAAPEPNIVVTPLSIDFGGVTVGDSPTADVVIDNDGTADLSVTALNLTGNTDFSLVAPPGTPFTIAPGGSQTVTVQYSPSSPGPATGSLAITSNDPDTTTVTVGLDGTGVAAAECNFTASPSSLDFGNIVINNTVTSSTTVTNTSTVACAITASVTGSVDFSLVPPASFTVPAGGTADVSVDYTPLELAADSGNLALVSDNAVTVNVGLSGTGVAEPVCDFTAAPLSLSFGSVVTGNTATRSTTVTNTSTVVCNITASVTGSADFSLVPPASFTVAAGGTADVSVDYTPLELDTDSGNLALVSDNSVTVNVGLSGTGVETPACSGITITNAEWRDQGNGQLRVSAEGVRDGPITLENAFVPDVILQSKNGNNGRANFNVNGRNLDPVPCRVRVQQLDVGLCGEANVVNPPKDCAPTGPLTTRGDLYATPVGKSLDVPASRLSGVLYNDFGGLPPLTVVNVDTTGTKGTLTMDPSGNGAFNYTPPAPDPNDPTVGSDNATDTFTYQAQDANGELSDVTTVVIQMLSDQPDFKMFMNYELGMHCTGFEFAYCCVLPPYNSIVAQVIKPAQGDPATADDAFVDGFPRLLEGDPNEGLDGLNRETVLRDWDHTTSTFKKYQLRYSHDAQPRQEGNTSKPNSTTLISDVEGNSLQYFNTVFDSACVNLPDTTATGACPTYDMALADNALVYGPYNNYDGVIQGSGAIGDNPGTDNYANGWLNHFYIYVNPETEAPNLEGKGNTGLEGDKIRLGVAGQVEYPPNSGAALQPMGPTGNGAFENLLTFSTNTGTVVYTQAKVLEDLPIMLTSPRIWEGLGLPLTPFEDTIGFFADPGAVDEDAVRPYVAMKAALHEYPSGDAVIGSNNEPVIGFGTAPIDIPNCERCHSSPSVDPDTGAPNVNSPNWNRPDAVYPHGGPLAGTGLEDMTNLEYNFWLAYYDIVPGVDSDWYARLKGAAINMLTLHDYDIGTSFTVNYAGVECTNNPDPTDPAIDPDSYACSHLPPNPDGSPNLADLTDQSNIPQNTRLGNESVICQRCHADNVIANVRSGTSGGFPIPPITEAIHNQHRNVSELRDDGTGTLVPGVIVFNDSLGRDGGCQGCHPAHRSDGVMDEYPITLGGDNVNADGDNRLNPGGCFVGRDVHSNPMKDVDGAETPSYLTAVGAWLDSANVSQDQGDDRGIWCTNCHSQLSQEIWKTEDCNDLIRGDCLVNPRAEPTLADVAAAVGWTEQQAIDSLDPKVDGFDRTEDLTHAVWDPANPDANVATIEVDGGGNPVVTPDADGDISVNILSFCTTTDCVNRINNNKSDQSQWRYPANAFIDPVNNSGAAVPFSAATDGRDHWLAPGEPHCADCHQAPFTEQSGNFSAYPPFNYPAKASLMRYTRGHQDVTCQGCHESIHGLYPVTPAIDTTSYAQAAALNNDGSHGPLKCASCHTHVDENQIPTWVQAPAGEDVPGLRYDDPTTPGTDDNIPVAGDFDVAIKWMHTYTAEADPAQDVCSNCHGPELPDINDGEYLEHAMTSRVSRVAMDAAERAVNNGEVFGETAGGGQGGNQRTQLCRGCHEGPGPIPTPSCTPTWNNHLIQGRISQVVWEDESAPLGGCGW